MLTGVLVVMLKMGEMVLVVLDHHLLSSVLIIKMGVQAELEEMHMKALTLAQ